MMEKLIVSSFEEIMPKLIAVSNIGGDVERVFKAFANQIAGKSIVAPGVVMAYALNVDRIAKEPMGTPMLAGIMYTVFPDVVDALFGESPEFAAAVIEFFEQVLSDMKSAGY